MQAQEAIPETPLEISDSHLTQFASINECCRAVGRNRSTLYRWSEKGLFPKAISIGPNTVGIRISDYQEWAKDPAAWAEKNTDANS